MRPPACGATKSSNRRRLPACAASPLTAPPSSFSKVARCEIGPADRRSRDADGNQPGSTSARWAATAAVRPRLPHKNSHKPPAQSGRPFVPRHVEAPLQHFGQVSRLTFALINRADQPGRFLHLHSGHTSVTPAARPLVRRHLFRGGGFTRSRMLNSKRQRLPPSFATQNNSNVPMAVDCAASVTGTCLGSCAAAAQDRMQWRHLQQPIRAPPLTRRRLCRRPALWKCRAGTSPADLIPIPARFVQNYILSFFHVLRHDANNGPAFLSASPAADRRCNQPRMPPPMRRPPVWRGQAKYGAPPPRPDRAMDSLAPTAAMSLPGS